MQTQAVHISHNTSISQPGYAGSAGGSGERFHGSAHSASKRQSSNPQDKPHPKNPSAKRTPHDKHRRNTVQPKTVVRHHVKREEHREEKKNIPQTRTVFFVRHRTVVRVEARYVPLEVVGAGAYGIVCSARDLKHNRLCAIKKIENVFSHKGIAKRTLRELIFLRHFRGHENIMSIQRVMRPFPESKDVYLVSDLMETDLACVIRSSQELSDDHVQFFIYQVLRGVKYLHSANVIHRDLKPRNLLVNSNCDLKICDFGLARINDPFDKQAMSDYIATRWYRAPEIILKKGKYSFAIDMWAVGCILGELLHRKALFPARDEVHQLFLIQTLVGDNDGNGLSPMQRLRKKLPHASDLALDLLNKLLCYDPEQRIDVLEALRHPYLNELHEEEDEPTSKPLNLDEFAFERRGTSKDALKDRIMQEILSRNPLDPRQYPMDEVAPMAEKAPRKDKGKRRKHKRRHSM